MIIFVTIKVFSPMFLIMDAQSYNGVTDLSILFALNHVNA